MLIQVKGGAAKTPSAEDIARMERVADRYPIGKVLLYQWNTNKKAGFFLSNSEMKSMEGGHFEPRTIAFYFKRSMI